MAKKSKFFRVATSGATTDGRTITPQDLIDMASTYNPETYQARVNLEHITSPYPDSTFRPYGDVIALKAEPVTLQVGGKAEARTALYAQINADDALVDFNARNQKMHTSIQVRPNFAGSGKAYLDGLAFTDNPASLGTEVMKFCAGLNAAGHGEASPLHFRKLNADSIFTAAEETTLEFDDTTPSGLPGADPLVNPVMAALRRVFEGFAAEKPAPVIAPVVLEPAAPPAADPAIAAAFAALRPVLEGVAVSAAENTAALAGITAKFAALNGQIAALQAENATITAALEKLPATGFTPRFRATGTEADGDQALRADC